MQARLLILERGVITLIPVLHAKFLKQDIEILSMDSKGKYARYVVPVKNDEMGKDILEGLCKDGFYDATQDKNLQLINVSYI